MSAWRPDVPGVAEVFHARFIDHAYPLHTHDAWSLLIIDDGAVRYDLDRHEHGALTSLVTLLPPHVVHDGRAATPAGFRKRVLYLESDVLGEHLIGRAVDRPGWSDPVLRQRIHQLHLVLAQPGEDFQAQARLALIRERLGQQLRGQVPDWRPPHRDPGLAERLRQLLDERVTTGLTLDEAAAALHSHPTHLVRAFTKAHGVPPHRYLTGRRIDLARRLLLDGRRPVEVATASGFYDQAHLTRHFKSMLGTTPALFATRSPR
ncbi:helix-turn-helix transcriptional regulator [Pseudonocardia spinosispora]|uniref:helix-turn-helix transcriptional regulator n=1 Tax=Pseudonocardia spinosispora TaxID=103441 RepID=UPI0003F76C26|nr:AraC family transcriptional regulator [Pseudonocardia spinosispora]